MFLMELNSFYIKNIKTYNYNIFMLSQYFSKRNKIYYLLL
ncbi:hypothetical protein THALO_350266 [Tenacibaculum halocynthiae]